MNILILGSGGREHALAWKVAQSSWVQEVWCAPGNPGMDEIGPCFDIDLNNSETVVQLVKQLEPHLVVVGPEAPLADGVSDAITSAGFDVFGPSKVAAKLESSKSFAKNRMAEYGVPTARYGQFSDSIDAKSFLAEMHPPYVIKADGLAAGKGVVIVDSRNDAEVEIDAMLSGRYNEASSSIVIEEFMNGEEVSVFALTDGSSYICLPPVQDHKRIGDGDTGANTGGMGAYAPAPIVDQQLMERIQDEIISPVLNGMANDGNPYRGVLYVGLMITAQGPKVVEFNVRFGDPECQVLMAGITGDIVPVLIACASGSLCGAEKEFENYLKLHDFRPTATVVMANKGYPNKYIKGGSLSGIELANAIENVKVFHAGTDIDPLGNLVATGGRVLAVTAFGYSIESAVAKAYQGVSCIDFPDGYYRDDIAWRALTK